MSITRNLLVMFIFYTLHISAQEMTCNEKIETQFIKKIKPFNSKDLIPYFSEKENKWGYFDRTTKKIITKPIMKEPCFFKPDIKFYYSFETNGLENGCSGKILGSKDNYKIESLSNAEYQSYAVEDENPATKKTYKSMIKEDINGFEVDENGKLTNFNSKFYNEKNDEPAIQNIIFFKNNYYAITEVLENGKSYFSIINKEGQEFSNYKKIEYYPRLKQIYSDDTDLWFLTKTNNGKYIFKSLLNNIQLEYAFDDYTIYGENQEQSLGYVIYTVDKKNGVFDLTTMKWKIKPSDKNDFSYIYYASSEPLSYSYQEDELRYKNYVIISNKDIYENRKRSNIYIQSSRDVFYDLELKPYKPKKK